ncbi:MAG: hypothetical protein ACOYMN_16310 [Roseimicrobium sp.]
MPPRVAVNNGITTLVILFFMVLLGMLLKAWFRLPQSRPGVVAGASALPKAIPVAIPVEETVHEARAFRQGDWWVLPSPQLVESRANEADTLRIKSGPKEDVFVLYYVDAAEMTLARIARVRELARFFDGAGQDALINVGASARDFVVSLLQQHPFKVYTKWGRVPDTDRFYAFVSVEVAPGKFADLGELLVRRGYAAPIGLQTVPLPPGLPAPERYLEELTAAVETARSAHDGAWGLALNQQ